MEGGFKPSAAGALLALLLCFEGPAALAAGAPTTLPSCRTQLSTCTTKLTSSTKSATKCNTELSKLKKKRAAAASSASAADGDDQAVLIASLQEQLAAVRDELAVATESNANMAAYIEALNADNPTLEACEAERYEYQDKLGKCTFQLADVTKNAATYKTGMDAERVAGQQCRRDLLAAQGATEPLRLELAGCQSNMDVVQADLAALESSLAACQATYTTCASSLANCRAVRSASNPGSGVVSSAT